MRVYKTLLLLLIVSTSCNAPVDKWQEVRSDKDGFIVEFPGSVKTDTREKEFSETENTMHNSCEARPREGVAYRVDTLYYPLHFVEETEPEQLFQMMIEGGVGAVKGTLEYEKDVVLDDFPGKEYQVGLETSGARIRSRLYIVDHRVYNVFVRGKDNDPIWDDDVPRFFESFRLLQSE